MIPINRACLITALFTSGLLAGQGAFQMHGLK